MLHRAFIGIAGATVPLAFALAAIAAPAPAPVPVTIDYNRDVRPILAENCFACHGADAGKRMAGLRLDTAAGAYEKLKSGRAAVVPGKAAESELLKRIVAKNALVMPPAATGKQLTPRQIAVLQRWVAQGARYDAHWSYVPIRRAAPPAVRTGKWPLNPVDRFILARLEQEGLKPSPVADRRTLIRRLSLDLLGLPPKPEEVDQFLNDRAPGAYERLVDRLLASPHYGERMAQYWLDLVRYADTVGYHGDQDFTVWPYRDYVIRSFNSNKGFDQFTREQLAGDLLPNAGVEQRVASGYNRLGMMSAEGGVQDKEYRAKYAADRVRNASVVWLGLTMGCAECHDHKYDPISAKDFYSFAAFFADINERGFYAGGYSQGDWGPSLKLPTEVQAAEQARLEAEIEKARKALAAVPNESLAAGRSKWEAEVRALDAAKGLGWQTLTPTQAASSGGAELDIGADGVVMASGKLPEWDTYTVTAPAEGAITALRLDALPDEMLPGNGVARAGYYFILSEFEAAVRRGAEAPQPVRMSEAAVTREDEGFPALALLDGRPETGWAMVHGGGGIRSAVLHLTEPLLLPPGSELTLRLRHETRPHLAIGKFKVSVSAVPGAGLVAQGLPDRVLAAVRKAPETRDAGEKDALITHYRTLAPELRELRERLERLEADLSLLLGRMPHTLVTEAVEPRTIRILPRGNWMDDSGPVVQPATPGFLKGEAKAGRATRLDLANWLVSAGNPLTARVFVNRLWKLYFGTGLAKNVDDFGAQGEAPVHPELLDWLAGEFIRSGWDVKRMVRLMVSSATYRQRSDARPDLVARDPFNRLYARQSAFRLDAEFVRDVALAANGLLNPEIGGRSVYPPQPRGYVASLNFPKREWAADTGRDLYRRGLYTHWQRTFLHPSLVAFDAPTREECTASRIISNTPMQALVLLNDPIFAEAARVFAERILKHGGTTLEQRLTYAYRCALAREPRPEEIGILRGLYHSRRARYSADRNAAQEVISIGEAPVAKDLDPVELATWASVARAVLNLHETITRD